MKQIPVKQSDYGGNFVKSNCDIDGRLVSSIISEANMTEPEFPLFIKKNRQTEAVIRENGLLFEAIFKNTAIGIALVDLEGRIIEINPAFQKMLGFTKEELLNQNFNILLHPNDPKSGNFFYVDMILSEHDQYQIEKRFIGRNGQVMWGRLTVSMVRGPGLESEFLVAMIEDISKRKQMEEALIAEKKRLAITLCSIGDGVITTDIDGNIILMNKIAENLTGWEQAEVSGKPITKIFYLIDTETSESYKNPALNVWQRGNVTIDENIILISRDGTERYISFNIAPIHNSMGVYSGAILVFRDITEKRKMEKELIKSQKYESMAMLAGGVAHDFNNILAGILANVQLTEVLYAKGKNISKNLGKIVEAVKRAANLTKQLLTFAKGGVLVKRTTSIVELIKATTDFILCGSNVKSEYSFPEDIWPVEADEGQLSQVIHNLVINAVQAMPDGGKIYVSGENIELEVEVTLPLPKGKYVKVVFMDTGSGIPEGFLSKIFDPYFTTKEKGSGLGLATSYSIIKKHEGYIGVESTPAKGTAFYIYLPSQGEKIADQAPKRVTIFNGKGKLQLMDDEETIHNSQLNSG
jgi:PAS domain S-box-containing protein